MLRVLEIAAGRTIAPHVGNSLYSWTSVIGVGLAGSSVGNWPGGWLKDHDHEHCILGLTPEISVLTLLSALALIPACGTSLLNQRFSLA